MSKKFNEKRSLLVSISNDTNSSNGSSSSYNTLNTITTLNPSDMKLPISNKSSPASNRQSIGRNRQNNLTEDGMNILFLIFIFLYNLISEIS